MTMTETTPANTTAKAGRPENLTRAGIGKAPGTQNATTRLLKEAILSAAELADASLQAKAAGDPSKAREIKGTLTGYLAWLAEKQPTSFAGLLGRVLPIQIKTTSSGDAASGEVDLGKLGESIAFALRFAAQEAAAAKKTINITPTPQEKP